MAGSGIGRKTTRDLATAVAIALVAILAGPLSSALAAPPNLTITSPQTGSSIDFSQPPFIGTTEESVDAVMVKIYAGTVVAGSPVQTLEVLPAGGKWEVSPPASLADQTYTAVAEQFDVTTLETASSSPVTFVIDTTPPSVSIDPLASPTRNSTPTIEGVAGTATGDQPTVNITIFEGSSLSGNPVGFASAQASAGAWSATLKHLPDGIYTVQATQDDAAGNHGESSGVTFAVDTKPPVLSITSPSAHAELKSAQVTFSGKTSGEAGDAGITIEIFAGEGVSGRPTETVATHSGLTWTTGTSGPKLSNGTYTVRAKQVDTAGNSGLSAPVTFSVNSSSPAVTLNALPRFIKNTTPGFGGRAESSAGTVTLTIWIGNSASGTLAVPTISGPVSAGAWTAQVAKPLPEGTYTAQAQQGPKGEGVSEASTFTVDTTPPQLSLSTPTASNGLQPVSGSAGTEPGDLPGITIQLFSGAAAEGAPVETLGVNASGPTWSAAFAGLGPGVYTVRALQSDEAGNQGASTPSTFTVTSSSPSPPLASFTWVPASPYVGQSVSLVSNSAGVGSPLTGFAWDPAGNEHFSAGSPVFGTSFSTPGGHIVRLRVTDANGLASVATERINVTTPPAVLMQPFPVVRIVGSVTSSGARLKLLSVQAPLSTMITITCKGHGCKTKSESRLATASKANKAKAGAVTLAFQHFERAFRAGAVLQVRVTKAGQIGKYTSFTIRHHKLPVRSDACLRPTSSIPIVCPSS
jgi:uncharacterized protein (DUF2141 family)